MIVNELVTKFKFDVGNGFKNFDKQLKNEARMVDKTTRRMGRLFRALGKDIASGMKHRLRIDGAKAAQRDLQRIKNIAGKLKGSLKGLAIGGAIGGGLAAVGLAKSIFDTNVEISKMKAAMKTAVGPAGDFTKEYQRIKDFASTTPFALEQSMGAFVKLKNLGLDPSNRALKSYGNTASAMGKDLNQMIEAVADASTGEFERLKEFGIKAKQQGDSVSFTFNGVTKTIKKDSKSIQDYLLSIGETKFAKAMADQMVGLPGLVSNIADNFTLLKLAMFEDGGLEKAIVPVLAGIRDGLANLKPYVVDAGKFFSDFIRDARVFAKLKIGPWLKSLPDMLEKLEEPAKLAAGALFLLGLRAAGVRLAFAGTALAKGLQTAAGLLYSVGLKGFFAAAGAWAAQIAIGGLAFAIGAVVLAQSEFAETGDSFLVRLADKWFGLGWAVESFHISMEAVKMGLADLASADGWVNILTFNFELVKTVAILAWNQLKEAWRMAVADIQTLVTNMKQNFINTWNLVKEKATEVGNAISSGIGGALEGIGTWLAGLGEKARIAFGKVVQAALDAARRMPVLGSVIGAVGALTMNSGGMVPGGWGTKDTVPAMLTPGEVVVPVAAVRQIQSGDPRGFAKVAQLAQTKMPGTMGQPQTYSMPAATVAGNAGSSYATNITAPISQIFNMNMGSDATPTKTAQAVANKTTTGIRRELDFVARQAPQRVARA